MRSVHRLSFSSAVSSTGGVICFSELSAGAAGSGGGGGTGGAEDGGCGAAGGIVGFIIPGGKCDFSIGGLRANGVQCDDCGGTVVLNVFAGEATR